MLHSAPRWAFLKVINVPLRALIILLILYPQTWNSITFVAILIWSISWLDHKSQFNFLSSLENFMTIDHACSLKKVIKTVRMPHFISEAKEIKVNWRKPRNYDKWIFNHFLAKSLRWAISISGNAKYVLCTFGPA